MASPKFYSFDQTSEKYRLWAFTVKVLSRKEIVDEKSYEPFFKVLYQLSEVVTMCGEVDSKGILHYHGVIRLADNFYRKNLRVKGYHLYLKRINNLLGWIKYCLKNSDSYKKNPLSFDKEWDVLNESLK